MHLSLSGVYVLTHQGYCERTGGVSKPGSNTWPLGLHLVTKCLSILLCAAYYVHASLQDTNKCKAKVIFQRACSLMRETLA